MLLWLRIPAVARDTLWAEDGRQFLAGAERYGVLNLLTPYAGYLQVVPRLIAGVVVTIPVDQWARGMTAGACIVSGAVTVLVYVCAASVVPARTPRLVLAAVTVLLPLGPRDVFGNPTNIHSVLMWGLFWVLLAGPESRRARITLSVAGLVCALSEIQSLFLVPLVLVRVRRPEGRLLMLGPALGMLAEIVATVVVPRSAAHAAPVGVPSLLLGYLINAVLTLFTSISKVGPAILSGALWVAGLLLAFVLALVVVAWRRLLPRARLATVAALILSPLIYIASVVVNPADYYDYATMSTEQLGDAWITRYGVVPGMLLLAVAIIAAAALIRGGTTTALPDRSRSARPTLRQAIAAATLVAIVLSFTVYFVPSWTRRSDGPQWAPAVHSAAASCATSSTRTIWIKETLGWHVPVPCSRILQTVHR